MHALRAPHALVDHVERGVDDELVEVRGVLSLRRGEGTGTGQGQRSGRPSALRARPRPSMTRRASSRQGRRTAGPQSRRAAGPQSRRAAGRQGRRAVSRQGQRPACAEGGQEARRVRRGWAARCGAARAVATRARAQAGSQCLRQGRRRRRRGRSGRCRRAHPLRVEELRLVDRRVALPDHHEHVVAGHGCGPARVGAERGATHRLPIGRVRASRCRDSTGAGGARLHTSNFGGVKRNRSPHAHPFRIRIYRDMILDSTVVCRRALGCEWGGVKRALGCEWGVKRNRHLQCGRRNTNSMALI